MRWSACPRTSRRRLPPETRVKAIARRFAHCTSAFFIGRGPAFPIALEGAQKLKEISYIHAEAYPASELKHGPLALVDSGIPTVAALPHDALLDKSIASIEEVRARSGPVIALTHPGNERIAERADEVIEVPRTEDVLQPHRDGNPAAALRLPLRSRSGASHRSAPQSRQERDRGVSRGADTSITVGVHLCVSVADDFPPLVAGDSWSRRLRDDDPPNGRARSSCPARRISVASSPQRATKCTPTGSPEPVQCSGMEIAG